MLSCGCVIVATAGQSGNGSSSIGMAVMHCAAPAERLGQTNELCDKEDRDTRAALTRRLPGPQYVCVVRVVPLLPPVDSAQWVRGQHDAFCLQAILEIILQYLAASECRGGRGTDCESHCRRGERWTGNVPGGVSVSQNNQMMLTASKVLLPMRAAGKVVTG